VSELLLGIDIGSYSSKGVLCRADGTLIAEARMPHEITFPKPGYAEHDAEKVWWHDFSFIARELVNKAPRIDQIIAVGVSGVGPCILPVDNTGKPLRQAILYGIDTRSASQIDYLEDFYTKEALLKFGGTRLTSQSAGPKILWIKNHEPEIYRQAYKFITSTTYIIHKLTGRYVLDMHTASYFNPLFNISTMDWDARFAGEIVDLSKLPKIGWSNEIAGRITPSAAKETGLPEGAPVTFGAIDGLAEATSVGVIHPGDLMIMYGSTAGFYLPIKKPQPTNEFWLLAGALKNQLAFGGGLATSGAATTWFRNQFGRDLLSNEAENGSNAYTALAIEAASSSPGANGLLMLPYLSGERTPIFDSKARGIFAGLTLSHTRGDMYRALLEGTAYAIRSNLDAMQKAGAALDQVIAVGGGTLNDLWLQIVSNVCGISQTVPEKTMGACYGDAFLAGLAVGAIGGIEALKQDWVKKDKEIKPDSGKKPLYDQYYQLFGELYAHSKEAIHQLADLQR
jgi:xylulokinase